MCDAKDAKKVLIESNIISRLDARGTPGWRDASSGIMLWNSNVCVSMKCRRDKKAMQQRCGICLMLLCTVSKTEHCQVNVCTEWPVATCEYVHTCNSYLAQSRTADVTCAVNIAFGVSFELFFYILFFFFFTQCQRC
jgi:hypothetical protein